MSNANQSAKYFDRLALATHCYSIGINGNIGGNVGTTTDSVAAVVLTAM